jgi:hypothetical protein
MLRQWNGLLCLLFLILFLGCHSPEQYLRPPKQPECFKPCPDDPRYERPPQFPADALKSIKKDEPESNGPGGFKGPRAATAGGFSSQ